MRKCALRFRCLSSLCCLSFCYCCCSFLRFECNKNSYFCFGAFFSHFFSCAKLNDFVNACWFLALAFAFAEQNGRVTLRPCHPVGSHFGRQESIDGTVRHFACINLKSVWKLLNWQLKSVKSAFESKSESH